MKNLGCNLGCIQTLGCKLGSMDTKNKMRIEMQTIVEVRIVGDGRTTSSLRLRRLFACSLRVLVFSQEGVQVGAEHCFCIVCFHYGPFQVEE